MTFGICLTDLSLVQVLVFFFFFFWSIVSASIFPLMPNMSLDVFDMEAKKKINFDILNCIAKHCQFTCYFLSALNF